MAVQILNALAADTFLGEIVTLRLTRTKTNCNCLLQLPNAASVVKEMIKAIRIIIKNWTRYIGFLAF